VIVVVREVVASVGGDLVARPDGDWMLRQLVARGAQWTLRALDPRHAPIDIPDLGCVRGVVIQKSRPGHRRDSRRYPAHHSNGLSAFPTE
jgi:DNA polymerase V